MQQKNLQRASITEINDALERCMSGGFVAPGGHTGAKNVSPFLAAAGSDTCIKATGRMRLWPEEELLMVREAEPAA